MSLLPMNTFPFRHKPQSSHSLSATLDHGAKIVTEANPDNVQFESTKERIRKLFNNVQLSVSSYDTAWVALVPSPTSSCTPFFPECIDWLLGNQLSDGSWGLPYHQPFLIKDALSSTLASVLALKRWGVGEEQISRGLHFLESNVASVSDDNQHSLIGFDVIFPGLIKYAEDLNLNIPFEPSTLDAMFRRREFELRRGYSEGRISYLAYISEGVGKSQDWDMVMKYQRKNGSLFNSPSTTAAAYMQLQDDLCLNYLRSLLAKFRNAVPTVYPLDIYVRLCMVDSLERLGIDRHFKNEIRSVLDEAYSYWLQGEEEIFLDSATCAMAFRLLRLNGYDVSSDHIMRMTEEELDYCSPGGHQKDISAALELYRASEIILHPGESALEKQNSWCGEFLKHKVYNGSVYVDRHDKFVSQEVDDVIKFPFHANLDRTASKRNIKHYSTHSTHILKTSYCSPNIRNEDFLTLAVEDFNVCQSIHREELKTLERWVVEKRLDKLKFARQKSVYCYFSAAATIFSPELSDARMSWAKNAVLTTVIDDFFDVGGSMLELENLIHLIQKWDVNVAVDCCSEQVQIIFSALHSTICEIGAKAYAFQGRSVTNHVIEIWLDLVNSMMKEAKWATDKSVPTMDEYMNNGYVSFALGPIVLPALYFLGPKLPDEVVCSSEYQNLFRLMSTCGRLLNDINTFERESKDGKLNAVPLFMIHGSKTVSENKASEEMKSSIARQRRELLRLVLRKESSLVPQPCKDLFWKMSKVLHSFYIEDDGFTSDHIKNTVKAIIYEPVSLTEL